MKAIKLNEVEEIEFIKNMCMFEDIRNFIKILPGDGKYGFYDLKKIHLESLGRTKIKEHKTIVYLGKFIKAGLFKPVDGWDVYGDNRKGKLRVVESVLKIFRVCIEAFEDQNCYNIESMKLSKESNKLSKRANFIAATALVIVLIPLAVSGVRYFTDNKKIEGVSEESPVITVIENSEVIMRANDEKMIKDN